MLFEFELSINFVVCLLALILSSISIVQISYLKKSIDESCKLNIINNHLEHISGILSNKYTFQKRSIQKKLQVRILQSKWQNGLMICQ